jgi:hypothetical protein
LASSARDHPLELAAQIFDAGEMPQVTAQAEGGSGGVDQHAPGVAVERCHRRGEVFDPRWVDALEGSVIRAITLDS